MHQITITDIDLWYLFLIKSPNIILGFPSPVRGFLKHDIESITEKTSQELIKKGIISRQSEGLLIDPKYDDLIVGIAHSENTILCVRNLSSNENLISYHYKDEKIIYLERISETLYGISIINSKDSILANLTEGFYSKSTILGNSFPINNKVINDLREAYNGDNIQIIVDKLAHLKIAENNSEKMVRLFVDPKYKFSLVVYKNKHTKHGMGSNGVSFLGDDESILMLEPINGGAGKTMASFVSIEMVSEKIQSLLP